MAHPASYVQDTRDSAAQVTSLFGVDSANRKLHSPLDLMPYLGSTDEIPPSGTMAFPAPSFVSPWKAVESYSGSQLNVPLLYPTDRDLTRSFFRRLVGARGTERELFFDYLVYCGDSDTVVRTAVEDYRRLGNERRLTLAASVLGNSGEPAPLALRELFQFGVSESAYFTHVVAYADSLSRSDKEHLLRQALASNDLEVQEQALDALKSLREE